MLKAERLLAVSLWRIIMAIAPPPTEICASAQAPGRPSETRGSASRSSKPPLPASKKTKRQRSAEASQAARSRQNIAQLPDRLLRSGASLAVIAIGLGIYGLERDSGPLMLASGASMVLGTGLTGGALARYLQAARRR